MREVLVVLLLLYGATADARTWRILNDGSGDAPTIQAGIDSAAAGDTVLVGPGTYLESVNFIGKDVVLKSQGGPVGTIIDATGLNEAVVIFENDEGEGAVLEGFTLRGGRGHAPPGNNAHGGGIYIRAIAPKIMNNRVMDNTASFGGGIYISAASDISFPVTPLIQDNIVMNNNSQFGGGIAIVRGSPTVDGNLFCGNLADFDGGGGFVWLTTGMPVLIQNEFRDNIAGDHGGGFVASDRGSGTSMATISYNLIHRNRAEGGGTGDTGSGGGVWLDIGGQFQQNTIVSNFGFGETICSGGGLLLESAPANLDLRNNIIALNNSCGLICELDVQTLPAPNVFWNNVNGNLGVGSRYCGDSWAQSAIIADPLFCDLGNGDYRLAENSPAVGMGAFPDPSCPPVSTTMITWGGLKALFRK